MRFLDIGLMVILVVALTAQTGCGGEGEEAMESSAAESSEVSLPEGHPDISGTGRDEAPPLTRIAYACAEGQGFELALLEGTETAQLTLDGQVYELAMRPVASGMEYSDGQLTLRGKGMEAFVERDGESVRSDCKASGHPTSTMED